MQQSDTSAETPSGPAQRRGRQLPPINTTFVTQPIIKPTEVIEPDSWADRIPLTPKGPPPKPQAQRGGFKSLFVWGKSSKNGGSRRGSMTVDDGADLAHAIDNPSPAGINRSVRQSEEGTRRFAAPAKETANPHETVGDETKKTKAKKKQSIPKGLRSWCPPPLFQAYPQAVAHANLVAPVLNADVILRIGKHAHSASQATFGSDATVYEEGQTKESKKKHKAVATEIEWTNKIYVLVTAGCLLQYSGEGQFDRLPEKVMQLGKDSAAFASDAIPGKHWVLQISQVFHEDGAGAVTAARSKSVLSKLGFWSEMRRSVANFLLVMECAEDMGTWLVAVRKEIEALGGKKYCPDETRKNTDDEGLREKPSRKFLVKRDPSLPREQTPLVADAPRTILEGEQSGNPPDEVLSSKSFYRKSFYPLHRSDEPAVANPLPSVDIPMVHRPQRISSLAHGLVANAMVPSEPAPPSTSSYSEHASDFSSRRGSRYLTTDSTDLTDSHSSRTLSPHRNDRRKSMESRSSVNLSRPQSFYGSTATLANSPTTPNFSVPTFSKRFSQQGLSSPFRKSSAASSEAAQRTPPSSRGNDAHSRPDSVVGDLPMAAHFSPKTARLRASQQVVDVSSFPLFSVSKNPKVFEVRPHSAHSDYSITNFPSVALEYPNDEPTQTQSLWNTPFSTSPHPPPTQALPSLPTTRDSIPRPASAHSSGHSKNRRPFSTQADLEHPLPKLRPISSQPSFCSRGSSPLPDFPAHLRSRVSVLGPPAAPPPQNPLPRPPSITVGSMSFDLIPNRWTDRSSKSLQNVQVS